MKAKNLIDTHAHLYLEHFRQDLSEVLQRSLDKGIYKIILPNIDSGSIHSMMKLAEAYPGFLYPTIGLHPGSVRENFREELKTMETRLEQDVFTAIGEIGIDCYWDTTHLKEQIESFEYQLELARQKNLPVIIHCRESFDLIMKSLHRFRGILRGVFHAFTGTKEQACRVLDMGFFLGLGGVITFKNSPLPGVISDLPMSCFLLETDSPYLTPAPHRGKRNDSSYLTFIADKISEIKGIPSQEVAVLSSANATNLFQLD
jgi:TatD DNase family protein